MNNDLQIKITEAKDKCQKAILDAIGTFNEETGLTVSDIDIERKKLYYNEAVHSRTEVTIKVEL